MMKNNFDKNIQKLLNSYAEKPSAECWNKILSQLDALQMPDSNVGSASSGNISQFMGSIAGKVVSTIVGAAVVGGIITLVVLNTPENDTQTQNKLAIFSEEMQEKLSIFNEEEKTRTSNESVASFKENKNTTFENIIRSQDEYKDTENFAESRSAQATNTTQNVTTTPTVQQETENVTKTETVSKTDTKRRRPFFNSNSNEPIIDDEIANNEIPQEVKNLPKFIIPNIFTPNGDGSNDYFVIENIEQFPENQLYICNRYGKVVYEKTNYKNDWGAENLPDDVYFYKFDFIYNGTQSTRTGSVTVKR